MICVTTGLSPPLPLSLLNVPPKKTSRKTSFLCNPAGTPGQTLICFPKLFFKNFSYWVINQDAN